MKRTLLIRYLLLQLLTFLSSYVLNSQSDNKLNQKAYERLRNWRNPLKQWEHIAKPKLDSVSVNKGSREITLFFKPDLSYYPIREESYNIFMRSVSKQMGTRFKKYKINVLTNNYSLDRLIPNYYRNELSVDSSRIPYRDKNRKILIKRMDGNIPSKGLHGNSIALWPSHGFYYEMSLDRWEWQRAKLFGTVEDISTMGYVVPYLTRMLENAGATVFLPRERDIQTNEIIVDNDRSSPGSELIYKTNTVEKVPKGFLLADTLFTGLNPFQNGTSLRIINDSAIYIPEFKEKGDYAVYISYPLIPANSREVRYIVCHTGGRTEFIVDQTIGGGTWIYLGTFTFNPGKSVRSGSVVVKSAERNPGIIALDAVRFGGGMGNVARRTTGITLKNQRSLNDNITEKITIDSSDKSVRTWKLSGVPRYLEAARYWLQYSGMPDTLVYTPNKNMNDYNDDYQSRGLWVNYLIGDPGGSSGEFESGGLGLPVDLSMAFHTDAGITPGDSTIGTLGICHTSAENGKFPSGTSRMASRDLMDIIQTQVVEDIRKEFDPEWTRRGLWDKPYSEARRPDIPAILLELLSHQNLADMRFGLDPRFRFLVSRSVYKGILRYLSYNENRDYIVQPLPVNMFAITPLSGKKVKLSWEPVIDPNEPSSKPERYRILSREGNNGFDNGFFVTGTSAEIELPAFDSIYSFKITALNEGGESFDSEVLSVGIKAGDNSPVLVVNGFDRISGPKWFDNNGMAGIAWWDDRGVAFHKDIITIGDQYDFDRNNPWIDDDAPGWGATYNNSAGKIIPGNTFDYPFIHGKAILASGKSFFSMSDEYFESQTMDVTPFKTIDLIFGEEKSTKSFNDTSRINFRIYTPEFMKKIEQITKTGTGIFISGAYVGSDLYLKGDSTAIKFAEQTLHFRHRTGHAVKIGEVYTTDNARPSFTGKFTFNTEYSDQIYSVEAPDAIEPANTGAICSFRYSESNASAGVIFKGSYNTVILGFPFETIQDEKQRELLMNQILRFLTNKHE